MTRKIDTLAIDDDRDTHLPPTDRLLSAELGLSSYAIREIYGLDPAHKLDPTE